MERHRAWPAPKSCRVQLGYHGARGEGGEPFVLLAALERWGLVLPRMKPGVCVGCVCGDVCVWGG